MIEVFRYARLISMVPSCILSLLDFVLKLYFFVTVVISIGAIILIIKFLLDLFRRY